MAWTAFLVETISGQVGPRLELLDGSWTDGPLNSATSGSVTVPTEQLRRMAEWWWSPWSGSVLICHDDHPIVLGPIIDDPRSDRTKATLNFGGFWDILDRRVATAGNFTPGNGDLLAQSVMEYQEYGSLGDIAWDLVARSQLREWGGLPVVRASPSERGTATRTRNYEGFNVSNNWVGKRLKEITEVINGPDIAFRPQWGEFGAFVQWAMYHGTDGMPEIGQEHTFTVDLTAPNSAAVDPVVSAQTNPYARAYLTGAGQGETVIIEIVDRALQDHMPWLETVESDTQTENRDLLREKGAGLIANTRVVQMALGLRADSRTMPLHLWNTGDEMAVRVPEGYLKLPQGLYRMRILSRSGSVTSELVKVEFQPESRVGEDQRGALEW